MTRSHRATRSIDTQRSVHVKGIGCITDIHCHPVEILRQLSQGQHLCQALAPA